MSLMTCSTEIPEVAGLKSQELTVGRIFVLRCQGDWQERSFDGVALEAKLEPKDKNKLKILSGKVVDAENAEFQVVSYGPGMHEILKWTLKIGDETLEMPPVVLRVESVIEGSQQQPKPFPPIGPLQPVMPEIVKYMAIGLAVALLLTILISIVSLVARSRQRRALKSLDSSLPPTLEAQQKLRGLLKQTQMQQFSGMADAALEPGQILRKLRDVLEVHLSRHARVLVTEKKTKVIIAKVKKRAPAKEFEVWGSLLAQSLFEIDRFGKPKKNAETKSASVKKTEQNWEDLGDLIIKVQNLVELMSEAAAKSAKKARS